MFILNHDAIYHLYHQQTFHQIPAEKLLLLFVLGCVEYCRKDLALGRLHKLEARL